MRYVSLVAAVALALGASLVPPPESPTHGDELGIELPPISICPLIELGEVETEVSILSNVVGDGRITSFSGGSTTGVAEFRTGEAGSTRLPAAETSVIGLGGGLIELPTNEAVAGVTMASPTVRSSESCPQQPSAQTYLMGGSTAGNDSFEILLLNPYAGEATVGMLVTSEAGIESDSRFDAVVVPPLSTVTVDLDEMIPGRESLAVTIEARRGSVLAVAQQGNGTDRAVWNAVAPGQDWWVLAPEVEGTRSLLVGNPVNTDVEYQIDVYGPDGFVEGFDAGVIPARSELRIPTEELSDDALGFRVIATAPVVAGLSIENDGGLAVTTGSPIDAVAWLLPGASNPIGGEGYLTVLNSGIEPVIVTLRSLGGRSHTQTVDLRAEQLAQIRLVVADGYRIEATGPVVVMSMGILNGSVSVATGVPLLDE